MNPKLALPLALLLSLQLPRKTSEGVFIRRILKYIDQLVATLSVLCCKKGEVA